MKYKREDRRSMPKSVIVSDSMVKEIYDPNLSKDLQNKHHIIKTQFMNPMKHTMSQNQDHRET